MRGLAASVSSRVESKRRVESDREEDQLGASNPRLRRSVRTLLIETSTRRRESGFEYAATKDRFGKLKKGFLEEWNESGIAKLARHIVHRKATLDFLKASLKVNSLGRYELESAIHQLIFPLRKTSDDVRPDQINLWILDEKLTYHYYLASDIPFDRQDVRLPSKDRADIIIFSGPSAFVNETPPFSSVVLIEFKRPLRDDYTDEENPIAQIYRYAELIKSGKATDRGGRPIVIKVDTPI